MTVIILCALMAVATSCWLVHPMMKDAARRRAGLTLCASIGGVALILYLLTGAPDTPSAAALFENEGARAKQRALTGQELTLMQAVAEDTTDIKMQLALGETRLRAGRAEDAVAILENARGLQPNNQDVLSALGFAHYAAAIELAMANDIPGAKARLDTALKIAPENAPYRAQIMRDRDKLSQKP